MRYRSFDLRQLHYSRGWSAGPRGHLERAGPLRCFIDFCADHIKPKHIVLETGCCYATSTVILAHFARYVFTVDVNFRPEAIVEIARRPNISPLTCSSLDVSEQLRGIRLDLVYLDALHEEDYVTAEINTLVKHVNPRGIIAGHDYGDRCPGVAAAVNKAFGKPDKVYGDTTWMKRLK